MNKTVLGTILGSALISLAKDTLGSRSTFGNIDPEKALKVKARITFVPSAVDRNTKPMMYGTPADYLVFLNWHERINHVAKKMREFNQAKPQDIQAEYWNEDWDEWREEDLIDAFSLPGAVIYDDIMEPAYVGSYILPSHIEFAKGSEPMLIGELDIRQGAADLYLDSGNADEEDDEYLDYDIIPEQYIREAFQAWTVTDEAIDLIFYFPINEQTINADISDFKTSIIRVIDATVDSHIREVNTMYTHMVTDTMIVSWYEIVSYEPDLPLSNIFQPNVRRY